MPIYAFEGLRPVVDPTAFVHPTASIIGDVIVGAGCLVGPGASLRGDIGRITMEAGSNVQDNCTVHSFPGKDCLVAANGHVGHGAVLHGCTVGRNALIGMNAVVMDDAIVGEGSLVGAMAFVPAEMEIAPRTLVAGAPARVIRELTEREVRWKTAGTEVYQHLARRYLATLEAVEARPEPEPDRGRVPTIDFAPKHEE